MNRLILHGRMTADPRVRYGEDESHTCFARWSMAVEDRSWKVDDTYHVDFIPCKAVGNVATVVANTCCKGKELVVWLDGFNTFSIYQVLPQLIELWGLNVQTDVEAKKTSSDRP